MKPTKVDYLESDILTDDPAQQPLEETTATPEEKTTETAPVESDEYLPSDMSSMEGAIPLDAPQEQAASPVVVNEPTAPPVSSAPTTGASVALPDPVATTSNSVDQVTFDRPKTGAIESFMWQAHQGAFANAYDEMLAGMYAGVNKAGSAIGLAQRDNEKYNKLLADYRMFEKMAKEDHPYLTQMGDMVGQVSDAAILSRFPAAKLWLTKASIPARLSMAANLGGFRGVMGDAEGTPLEKAGVGAVSQIAGEGIGMGVGYGISKTAGAAKQFLAFILGPKDTRVLSTFMDDPGMLGDALAETDAGKPRNLVSEIRQKATPVAGLSRELSEGSQNYDDAIRIGKAESKVVPQALTPEVHAKVSDLMDSLQQKIRDKSAEAYDYLETKNASISSKELFKVFDDAEASIKGSGDVSTQARKYIQRFRSNLYNSLGLGKGAKMSIVLDMNGNPIQVAPAIEEVPVPFWKIKEEIQSLDKDAGVGSAFKAIEGGDFVGPNGQAALEMRTGLDKIIRDDGYHAIMTETSRATGIYKDLLKKGFGKDNVAREAIKSIGKFSNIAKTEALEALDKETGGSLKMLMKEIANYNEQIASSGGIRSLGPLLARRDAAIDSIIKRVSSVPNADPAMVSDLVSGLSALKNTESVIDGAVDDIVKQFESTTGKMKKFANPVNAQAVVKNAGKSIGAEEDLAGLAIMNYGRNGVPTGGREPGRYMQAVNRMNVNKAFDGSNVNGSRLAQMIGSIPFPGTKFLGGYIDVFGKQVTKAILKEAIKIKYANAADKRLASQFVRQWIAAPERSSKIVIPAGSAGIEFLKAKIMGDKDMSAGKKVQALREIEKGINFDNPFDEETPEQVAIANPMETIMNNMGE